MDSPLIHKHFVHAPLSSEETDMLERSMPDGQISGAPNRLRWLKMATNDLDRAGDVIVISGIESDNFMRNPQFLWQHGQTGALVNTIGTIRRLHTTATALYALAEYAPEEISPLAEQIFRLDEAGYLPANSIGFRPIEWEDNDQGGHTFTKWELIECSKVELPMNPNAIDEGAPKSYSEPLPTSHESIDYADAWLAGSH